MLAVACCLTVSCSSSRTGDGGEADGDGPPTPDQLAATTGWASIDRLQLALVRPTSYRPDEVVLTDQAGVIVSDLLYDGLTEAVGNDGELRPGLAARWWADHDFGQWTFELDPRSGVDAWTVVEALAPLTSEHGGTRTRGRSVAALAAGMRSVEVAEDDTVVVELDRPNAGLPWVLSGLPFAVIGEGGQPTGDYSVTSDDGNGLVLSPRPGRIPDDRAAVPEVVVTWVDGPADGYRMVIDGLVDAAVVDEASASDAETRFGAWFPITSAVRFYVLNPESASLSTREDRLRVLAAFDPEAVIGQVPGLPLVAAEGLVPASAAGRSADACELRCVLGAMPEAGDRSTAGGGTDGPSGSSLRVSYAGEEQAGMAEAVADQLTAAGYTAEWSELEPRELAAAIVDGSTDLFAFGWVAPATSVDAVLPPLLAVDSPANVARIDSAEVATLLDEAARTADDELRWAVLERAHRAALDEAKVLPVANSTSLLVAGEDVADLVIRADGSIDLEWQE
jgi:ABC-type transport system substrate-binding protein